MSKEQEQEQEGQVSPKAPEGWPLCIEGYKITPAGTTIIVKQDKITDDEGKTKGGLIIPKVEDSSVELFEGVIVGAGSSVRKFSVGDRVIFGRHQFSTKRLPDGKEYLFMYENAPPAKIEEVK